MDNAIKRLRNLRQWFSNLGFVHQHAEICKVIDEIEKQQPAAGPWRTDFEAAPPHKFVMCWSGKHCFVAMHDQFGKFCSQWEIKAWAPINLPEANNADT